MARQTNTNPQQIRAVGLVASATLTANRRVMGARGPLGLITDVVTLPGRTGSWTIADRRVSVQGVPTVSAASVGVAIGATGPTPMRVVAPTARIWSS